MTACAHVREERLLLCVELFDIIGADACNFNSVGATVDAGCSGRVDRERTDYHFEIYCGRDHGFAGHDGRVAALAGRHGERVFLPPGLRFYERPASEKHPSGCG
jgi:hypothetical protein